MHQHDTKLPSLLCGGMTAAMTLAGLWVVRDMAPGARVAIHFDANGHANGWASPLVGVLLVPLIATLLWGIQRVLMRMADGAEPARTRELMSVIWVLVAAVALMALCQGLILATALGMEAPTLGQMLLPIGAFVLLVAATVSDLLSSENAACTGSPCAVRTIRLATIGGLVAIMVVLTAAASGKGQWQAALTLLLPGVLFLVLGNVMGKLRRNAMVGIRTPWTLRSERVWDQTHRWGGKAMVLGGLVLLFLAASPIPDSWHVPTAIAVPTALAIATTLKSYFLWRALPQDQR